MSCWLRLISDVPLDWFLRPIIGSCGFREATAEELAAHHAKAVASFEERNPRGTTETERLAYEIQRKRKLGYLPGARYLMTSPAPAVDSGLPTDWLYVRPPPGMFQHPANPRPPFHTLPNLTGMKSGRFTVVGLSWNGQRVDAAGRPEGLRWVVRCGCGDYELRKLRPLETLLTRETAAPSARRSRV
jgi:hypothetical protein